MTLFPNIDPSVFRKITESQQALAQNLQKVYEPFRQAIHEFIKAIQKNPDSFKVLAENGWYFPFDTHPPTINYYADELIKGNSKLVDDEMITYLDQEVKSIEKEMIQKFPHRKAPIKAAIRAHTNKDYYLSIPVFFSQAEGICEELTGYRFFSVQKGQPITKKWTKTFKSDSIMEIVLEPLKHSGITRQKQDLSNPLGINRHDVLHGTSVDYGEDKINSYKALSLLNFLADTVYLAKQDNQSK